MKLIKAVLLAAIAIFVLGACSEDGTDDIAGTPDVSPSARSDTEPFEGLWKLVKGTGPEGDVPVVKGWDVTGHIDNDEILGDSKTGIFGFTGCNNYIVEIKVASSSLSFGKGGYLEQAGCSGPAPEDSYLSALYASTEIERNGDRLLLSGEDAHLVFEAVPPPPLDVLFDQRWKLRKYVSTFPRPQVHEIDGDLLIRGSGSFEGSTGCYRLRGKWRLTGDRIIFWKSGARGRCNAEERDLYGTATAVLGDGFTIDIRGDKLTVFAGRGRDRLVYREAK